MVLPYIFASLSGTQPASYLDSDFTYVNTGSNLSLVSTATATNSSNIVFSSLPSTFNQYMLCFQAAVPATNADTLALQFSTNNGSSYLTTGNVDDIFLVTNSGSTAAAGHTSNSYMGIGTSTGNTASNGGTNGCISLYNLASSTASKFGTYQSSADNTTCSIGAIANSSVSIINAIKVFFISGGNIASGTFSLYGIRNVL